MLKRNKAFTLIEIIMAIVLLAIIAITIGIFVTQQLQAVVWSNQYGTAFNLARLEIEVVNNIPFASLVDGTTTTSNYDSYAFDVVRTVSTALSGSGETLKLVVVQVRPSGSVTNLVTLKTYIVGNTTIGLL